MPFATLLSIKVEGEEVLTDFGARNLLASLEPIPQATQLERTWNGTLIDLSMPQFRKHAVTVNCTDMESNGLVRFPPGTEATVILLPDLGVSRGVDDSENRLTMSMRFGEWREAVEEWAARNSWSLTLLEI